MNFPAKNWNRFMIKWFQNIKIRISSFEFSRHFLNWELRLKQKTLEKKKKKIILNKLKTRFLNDSTAGGAPPKIETGLGLNLNFPSKNWDWFRIKFEFSRQKMIPVLGLNLKFPAKNWDLFWVKFEFFPAKNLNPFRIKFEISRQKLKPVYD